MLDDLTLQNEMIQRLMLAVGVVVVLLFIVQVIKRLVRRYVDDPERQFRISRLVGRIGGILAVIFLVGAFFESTQALLTILTVVGAGLAIALRETLMSFFGWSYIILRTPYKPGDRIEVNGTRGDVIDVRLLHTTMMEIGNWVAADQSTGRLVHVPNSAIFLHQVFNYTRGFRFIWNEIPVTVTFRSDWQAAREIMDALASESAAIVEQQVRHEIKEMAQEYLIYYTTLTPFVYVRIVENGIRLTLRYVCEARKRRGTEHALTISMLAAFQEHGDIELAYPALSLARYDTPQFGPLPGAEKGSLPGSPMRGT